MPSTTKGQVTIPIETPERLGLSPICEVELAIEGRVATLREACRPSARGSRILEQLRGSGTVPRSTGEIPAPTRGAG